MTARQFKISFPAFVLAAIPGGLAQAETVWMSRPDLCGRPFPILELEDVTFLDAQTVDDHFITCRWSPPIEMGLGMPARQRREAACADGTSEWRTEVTFARADNGNIALRSKDARLPIGTYGACRESAGQGAAVERSLGLTAQGE